MFVLKPEVAAKYDVHPSVLKGQKLVFSHTIKHGVPNKSAHDLTLDEVDKLYAAGAVNGLFTLKTEAQQGGAINETADTTDQGPGSKKKTKPGSNKESLVPTP